MVRAAAFHPDSARLIREPLCWDLRFSVTTSVSAGELAIQPITILFKRASLHGDSVGSLATLPLFCDEPL